MSNNEGPLIIQSDMTVLLEACHAKYGETRDKLAHFAELVKCPDYIHTYRISRISIWNAAALGMPLTDVLDYLEEASRFPVPGIVKSEITDWYSRYGVLRLERCDDGLLLTSRREGLLFQISKSKDLQPWIESDEEGRLVIKEAGRGVIKQVLAKMGYPVEDLAGYTDGEKLEISFRKETLNGRPFDLRNYQEEAAANFHAGGSNRGGSGVVVLPCGAGKTVIAMAVMELTGTCTLVLTTNIVAARQWRRELLDKTNLTEEQVGEYSGERKELRPVTITTYQMATHRRRRGDTFTHVDLFSNEQWGLIVYDEVHLLPANIFRVTASIQAKRRLGLTATLVREDGKEEEVFTLIGPKRFDLPWKILERQGWIAPAKCFEVRVPLSPEGEIFYRNAKNDRERFSQAACNPEKIEIAGRLMKKHEGERILILGQYLDQLHSLAETLALPIITGATPNEEREILYDRFRSGEIPVLVLSKVGNFAVDLPQASVAIQISGTFGSRQEEAQRLGRILRPKEGGGGAFFYTLVSDRTREEVFSAKRQLFLAEQGYEYSIIDGNSVHEDEA